MSIHTRPLFKHLAAIAALTAATLPASADTLDLLGKAAGLLQQISNSPSPGGGAVDNVNPASKWLGRSPRSNLDWLHDYPRSELKEEFFNPMDYTVVMPLSPAEAGTVRFRVGMTGKISIKQYEHARNESPLLIMQYYSDAFAQRGFERVSLCHAKFCELGGTYTWIDFLDPQRTARVSVPHTPLALVAYKSDAMAFITVGEEGVGYRSLIKLVEGRYKNPEELNRWIESLRLAQVPGTGQPITPLPRQISEYPPATVVPASQ